MLPRRRRILWRMAVLVLMATRGRGRNDSSLRMKEEMVQGLGKVWKENIQDYIIPTWRQRHMDDIHINIATVYCYLINVIEYSSKHWTHEIPQLVT